jgi:peptide/nickel transport system substrate-binding protein
VAQIRSDGYNVVSMAPNGGGWAIMFNTTKVPFNDVRVRQAINLAVDRAAFNKSRRAGETSLLINTIDEKYSPFYDPTIKVPKTDLVAAQKLIDAYVADNGGKPVEFSFLTYASSQTNLDDVTLLAAQISRLKNVTVNVDSESTAAVIAKFTAGNYQAWHTTLGKWNEPAIDMPNVFLSTSPSNYAKWNNPTVDATLRQLTTETDQKTRVQLVHTIQQQILKDAPIVYYTRYASFLTEDKYVKNLNNYYDQRTLFDQVWVAKAKK